MYIMKKLLLLIALAIISPQISFAGKCTGKSDCTACKNCKACKHCKKDGGTCGACKPSKKK